MKVAVLSDIHSNDIALEAVIADAEKQNADYFIVAGDLIIDGPSTREVLERVQGLTKHVIKGNREDYMLRYRSGEASSWDGYKQFATLIWTYKSLTLGDLDYIAGLPEQLSIRLDDNIALRVVHGSPFSMYELLKPDEDMEPVEKSAMAISEQALIFGHNHMQWTGMVYGRLLMNPGTVGVHFNPEMKAEYGILTYEHGSLTAKLRRVPYDFTALQSKLKSSGIEEASPVWTRITFEGVKAGRNYILEFLKNARELMELEGIKAGMIPNEVWDRVAEKWWMDKGWGRYL